MSNSNELPVGAPLLSIENLSTHFFVEEGIVKAVDGVTFSILKGETFGLVGESGCGKSVTSLSVMGLIPSPPGKIVGGAILFNGKDLLVLSQKAMCGIRGKEIAMVFQEPMSALNPVMTVGAQIEENLEAHTDLDREGRRNKAIVLIKMVGIPDPETRYASYPHELSGGMRQRIVIAMALACKPSLLIADEPTTALDVTIQAQILELIKEMRKRLDMSVLLITHDLSVVAENCDRVAVMYAGLIVEMADVSSLFSDPLHPYTKGLLSSIPILGNTTKKLVPIKGKVPNLIDMPPGCAFRDRCTKALPVCAKYRPELVEVKNGHFVRCFLHSKEHS